MVGAIQVRRFLQRRSDPDTRLCKSCAFCFCKDFLPEMRPRLGGMTPPVGARVQSACRSSWSVRAPSFSLNTHFHCTGSSNLRACAKPPCCPKTIAPFSLLRNTASRFAISYCVSSSNKLNIRMTQICVIVPFSSWSVVACLSTKGREDGWSGSNVDDAVRMSAAIKEMGVVSRSRYNLKPPEMNSWIRSTPMMLEAG